MASSSRVITLDPSRQKLLIPPNEPLPKFHPMPQVLMITPIYNKRELSQGTYDSSSRSLGDYRSRDSSRRGDAYASSEPSDSRGAYSDSEWDDGRREAHGYRDARSREPRRRHDHWWSRHRRDSRDGSRDLSDSDSEDRYGGHRRHGDKRDRSMRREQPQSSHRRQYDDSSEGDYSSEGPPRPGYPSSARDEYASRSRPNGQYNAHPTSNAGHIDPSQSHPPSQSHGHAPSQNDYPPSHGYIPSQNDYPPSHSHGSSRDDYDSPHGHAPSQNDYHSHQGRAPSHASSQDNYHPAPNPQQLIAQLGQQAFSAYNAPHNGQPQKHGFIGGLAQAAIGHALSQNQQYSQHAPSNTHSQGHGGGRASSNAPSQGRGGGRASSNAHSQGYGGGRASSNAHSQYGGNDLLAGMHLPPATQSLLHYAQDQGLLQDLAKYFKVLPPSPNFCYSKCTGRKRAVCIGINYTGQKDELKGCANDARNMRDFIMKNYGFKSQDILLLIDDDHSRGQPRPTRKEMFNAMSWLVKGAQQHDSLFFHYSGHGGQSPDASGKEADGMDEVIFPVDYDDYHDGDGPGDIIDDELHEALVQDLPPGVRLTAIFDSCHSGTILDLPYLHSAHGRLRSMGHISKRAKQRGGADASDVICFAACKDDETSADTREGNVAVGAMSWAFIQALEQNRNQTYEELLQHLRATLIPKYHQKAQISGTHPVDLQRQFTL